MSRLLLQLCRLFVSSRLFISYRRAVSSQTCARIYERLAAHFGRSKVFFDEYSLNPGEVFSVRLLRAIRRSDYLLAVIGPAWLSCENADAPGKRRLDDPEDLVRREIETAFQNNVSVIPVLVDGAVMPMAAELPPTLRPLALLQWHRILPDLHHFSSDVTRLIDLLDRRRPWHGLSILLFVAVVLLLGVSVASRVAVKCGAFDPPSGGSAGVGDPASLGGNPPPPPPAVEHAPPSEATLAVGGFSVALPSQLPKSLVAPPPSYPVTVAPRAVSGAGSLVVLSRKAGLASGPWYLQDVVAFGSREGVRFRNWNPQGQGAEAAEEVCLLLCSEVELSALGDVPEVPVVVAEGKISGAVSAAKVAGLPSPANRSATHTVWVIK